MGTRRRAKQLLDQFYILNFKLFTNKKKNTRPHLQPTHISNFNPTQPPQWATTSLQPLSPTPRASSSAPKTAAPPSSSESSGPPPSTDVPSSSAPAPSSTAGRVPLTRTMSASAPSWPRYYYRLAG